MLRRLYLATAYIKYCSVIRMSVSYLILSDSTLKIKLIYQYTIKSKAESAVSRDTGFIPTLDMRPPLDYKHNLLKSLSNIEGFENSSYYFTGVRVILLQRKTEKLKT